METFGAIGTYGVDAAQRALGGDVTVSSWRGGAPYFIGPVASELSTDLTAVRAWIDDHRPALDELLVAVGGYVLRGMPVHDATDFDSVLGGYVSAPLDYSGGSSPRSSVQGRVYEATSAPKELVIPLHQEMAYLPKYPSRVAFFCRVPAETDGETLLASVREYQAKIDPSFLDELRARGELYRRNMRAPGSPVAHPVLGAIHREWTTVFQTDDPREAEANCDSMGLEWWWNDDGSLTTEYRTRGLVEHPLTGETLYFNHILSQSTHPRGIGEEAARLLDRHYPPGVTRAYDVRFGDGAAIDPDDVARLFDVADAIVIKFPWQHGDVLVLDNLLMAHGRNRFTGHRDVNVLLLD